MSDLIKREDAIATIGVMYERCDTHDIIDYRDLMLESVKVLPSADRPQGEWIGYEVPSECSVCGHCWDEYVFGQEIWYDGSVPNYCPHCGARMKGADDYERAIEQMEHDMLYEPTYNSEDGSM